MLRGVPQASESGKQERKNPITEYQVHSPTHSSEAVPRRVNNKDADMELRFSSTEPTHVLFASGCRGFEITSRKAIFDAAFKV